MQLNVIFDTVCPWCYIGKRRLERALALRPKLSITIQWHPFLLNPEMPPNGIDRTAYLIKKFGSEARVLRIYGAINEAGESVEIDFAFDRIRRTPNSIPSHKLIRYASQHIAADSLVEDIFEAYFIKGDDIGEVAVLVDLAAHHGLNLDAVQEYLESDQDTDTVYEENTRAHRLGINGVPAFNFNSGMVISGAQEPEVLIRVMDAASATGDVLEAYS